MLISYEYFNVSDCFKMENNMKQPLKVLCPRHFMFLNLFIVYIRVKFILNLC